MARSNFIQTSFRNGEYSPFSQGRSDKNEYYEALSRCADMLPVDAGALIRRSGTQFAATIDALQGGTTPFVQLMPFDTDDGSHYVTVLTPGNIQFFSAGTFATTGGTIAVASITQSADPAVFTTAAVHGLSVGDRITFIETTDADVSLARALVNVQLEIVTVPTTKTFTAKYVDARASEGNAGSTDFCWKNGGIAQIRQVVMPYTVTQLVSNKVKYTQDSDFLYLFHPDNKTQLIGEDLALTVMSLQDGPYFDTNETATTLALSGTTGTITVTASAVTGINGGVGFVSTDVGRMIRWKDPAGNWTWLTITVVGTTTSITATINGADASAGTATITWRLGLYSDTTGWPTHGVFHDLRLWLASDAQTGRIDGSKIIKFKQNPDGAFSFEPTAADGTTADNNGLSLFFNSTGRNRITWLSADDAGLMAGTSDRMWVIQASALDDPITPTSKAARAKAGFKASDALPVIVNRSTVFIGDLEKEVIEIRRFEGGYDAKNVSRDGEHLISAGLAEIYYANSPLPTLWGRTSDKQLIGAAFRRDKDSEQTGWHQHNLAHTVDPDKTAATGKVEAITVVKKSDKDSSNIDTLWAVVERNGFYCLEYMTPPFDQTRIDLEGFFADSGVAYDQSNFATAWDITNLTTNEYTFYGLWHLEGDVVDLSWRTMDLGTFTVSGGQVTAIIPAAAMALPSSYSTYADTSDDFWVLTDFTYTFSSGYVSDTTETDISETSVAPPPGGGGYLNGEDGNEYYMTMAFGNADDIWIVNKTTGTATLILTQAQMFDDMTLQGQDPLALMTVVAGGTRNGTAFIIPGTQYFIALGQYSYTSGSPNAAILVSYYKINSSGVREHVGGFVDWRNSVSTVTHIIDVQKHAAVGFLGQGRPLLDDILLGFKDNDDFPSILRLPDITSQIASGFEAFDPGNATTGWGLRQTQVTAWGTHFFHSTRGGTGQEDPYQNQGFFLPTRRGNGWGSYLASYVPMSTCQAELAATASPSSSYILAQTTEYPSGFMTAIHYTADPSGKGGTITSPEFFNCRWRDSSSTAMIPFADAGKDKTGAVDDFQDDYLCPSVFPTDTTDALKPWMVFFPRQYYNRPDLEDSGTFMGVRIFQWSPVSGTATELDYKEGSLFDITTELGVSKYTNNPASIYVHWNQTTNAIQLQILYFGTVPAADRFVITDFGSLTVDVGAGGDARKLEALNRGFDAVIGLNYVSQGQLLRPQDGSAGGPDLAKTRRVDQIGMILHRTGPFRIGTEFGTGNMESVTPSEVVEETGQRPLFTGVFHDTVPDDYSFDGQIAFEINRPGPGSFLAIGGFRNTQDR